MGKTLDNELVPKGNAQLGDRVMLRNKKTGKWELGWKVAMLGVKNRYGYPYDVRIKRIGSDYAYKVISPFDTSDVRIIPSLPELCEDIKRLLTHYSNLLVRRDPHNGTTVSYMFFCNTCGEDLQITQTQTEKSDLRFKENIGFYQGKIFLDDGSSTIRCGCANRTYDSFIYEWTPYF